MNKLEEFLAGERLDHVALFLADEYLDDGGTIADHGEPVDGGVVLVVPGDDGRRMFAAGTGMEAMQFARGAMDTDGDIADELNAGTCPDAGDGEDHRVQFVFAFAEAQNEEVGGRYAEGDVLHAYAKCACGTAYSDRWLLEG